MLGFYPKYTTVETFDDFVRAHGLRGVPADADLVGSGAEAEA
jgi:hypothetical protein